MREVYRFIGVDDSFTPKNYTQNLRKGRYQPIPPELYEMLLNFYKSQILKFSEMTGRDLSRWLEMKKH